jgi:hypothetical protein
VRRLLLLLLCLSSLVASPPRPRITRIRIPLWLDSNGDPGDEPATKDFSATLDGEPARVVDVKCPEDDLILLLVLDLSSGDLTVLDPAKQALIAELRKLSPKTYVGLLRSQDGLQVLADPTADRDKIVAAIEHQSMSGKAGLLTTVDVIGGIADSMLKKSPVRVAILYITDSDVRNYREDFTNPVINSSDFNDMSRRFPETLVQEKIAKLEAGLAAQQAPIFIAELNSRTDRLNEAYFNGLKQLADTTAGAAVFSRSSTEIADTIQKGFATAASHYSLTLALPDHVSARLQIHITAPESNRILSYRTRLALHTR